MYEAQRLQQATEVITSYKFEQPFIQHLKAFFKANKKLGSRDRRQLSELVYDYYRVGLAVPTDDITNRICIGHFLRNTIDTFFSSYISTLYPTITSEEFGLSISEKEKLIQKVYPDFSLQNIFPSEIEFSKHSDKDIQNQSILTPSITWIRAKQKHLDEIIVELNNAEIEFKQSEQSKFAIGFQKKTDFSKLKSFDNGFFEIQDLSSQLCVNKMSVIDEHYWWDVCSGSGGKALLIMDQVNDIHMTLSDNRKSILRNLEKRFKKAKIEADVIFELDATNKDDINALNQEFDRIMVDVPCTGSGTWVRNPEQILAFDKSILEEHNKNQKIILKNALTKLKKGGELYYMTCSVFKAENEDVLDAIGGSFKVKAEEMIDCTSNRGDNLFISIISHI
ncbi:MAG: hypothetical protein HKN75_12090 [Bacteroidia bacterium]|nr:hypothetical protein [Bacteroidia bacterium]